MPKTPTQAALTPQEKSIIKALVNIELPNQDIQALINSGRAKSVNSGRISGVKADTSINPATDQQVEAYKRKKLLFDHVTGLCPIENERLVRAREAMLLAVELFNTPRIAFKAGVFSMLANVAWTYLLHEFYESRGVTVINNEGYSLLLSQMIARTDFPLSKGCKNNLAALKEIRDVVEHRTIGSFDEKWLPLFQATCLNFEKGITELFGARLTLGRDLGFALQFAKLTTTQIADVQNSDLPEHIAALDASLESKLQGEDADDLEYQFKVVYTLTNATKSKAHFHFIQPDSEEGKEIQNVLIKYKPIADIYPLKPKEVAKLVSAASSRNFTSDTHQRAWKMFNARPVTGAADPSATNPTYCTYNAPYASYTYSKAWVKYLIEKIAHEETWQELTSYASKK